MLWPFTGYFSEGSKAVAALMDRSVTNCRRNGGSWELAVALLFRARVRIDAPGGMGYVTEDIVEVQALAEATGDRWLLGQLCGLRAELAIQEGRYDAARGEFEAAMCHAQQLGALTEIPGLLARIADIWFRQGDSEQADELAQRAVQDGERLGINDAPALALLLRSVIAEENGETTRARGHYQEAREYAAVGTPPAMLEVALRVLDARITASEADEAPSRPTGEWATEAVRKAREALRLAGDIEVSERLLAETLLAGSLVVHKLGHPTSARSIADAAEALRDGLPASVPEQRLDRLVRAATGHADAADPANAAAPVDAVASAAPAARAEGKAPAAHTDRAVRGGQSRATRAARAAGGDTAAPADRAAVWNAGAVTVCPVCLPPHAVPGANSASPTVASAVQVGPVDPVTGPRARRSLRDR